MTHPTDEKKSTETLLEEVETILCQISGLARVGLASTDAEDKAEDVLFGLSTVFELTTEMACRALSKTADAKIDVRRVAPAKSA